MECQSCNMSKKEAYVRLVVACFIFFYALYISSYMLGIISFVVIVTAVTRHCFVYALFNLNKKFSMQNYYLSLLPKHRTSPVFIFNSEGEILFQNDASQQTLPEVHSLSTLGVDAHEEFIAQNLHGIVLYEGEGLHYQVELKGLAKEGFLLAYCTDVTELVELNEEIKETQKDIIYAMGEIGETRSKETGNHVKRVALYSYELALLYGLSEEEANLLQMVSPMHDIGKIGIPDAILNAPRKLTFEEFAIMKTHAALGYEMLRHSNKPILQAAAIVAGEHHEKWDGSGYPHGKRAQEIHIFGRITAIADVFDALASERVYKKAWAIEDILELFEQEKGKHFEPQLIELFLWNLNQFVQIKEKFRDL